MNALAFLTPVAADPAVLARTPAESPASAAGAVFVARAGWNVATRFDGGRTIEAQSMRESVAVVDRSHMTKLQITGRPAALGAVMGAAGMADPPAPGRGTEALGLWWCAVTPTRVLVLAEDADTARAAVDTASAGGPEADVATLDLTCGLVAIALVGPAAGECLARFCSINTRPVQMGVGGFAPGSIARTPGYVLRDRADGLLLLAGWALGEYLWQVATDAAEAIGGGPAGLEALADHGQPSDA